MDFNIILAGLALLATLISNLFWFVAKYSDSQKKKYAAERDFNHLQRNQQQLQQSIIDALQDICAEYKTINESLSEIKLILRNRN